MTALFDLSGHVALVTGGNGGIGLGMADALASQGAAVAIWGTNTTKNAAAAEQLRAHGNPVLDLVCDVGDHQAVIDSMAATVAAFGRIDSCFVNAGVGGQAPSFVGMSEDEWNRVMRVNLDGAFFTAQEAVKQMVAQDPQGGSVVFTTSGSAKYGQQRGQHYGGSKGALIAMMKGIAVEHARHAIRCNAILPGWIESDMTAGAFTWDKFVDNVLPRVPMRRWGKPADFGGLAVYLASDASSYHTGDVITIDGGYHSF
jgi:NAD(P)-dependent dehydrogenase (short-subunit alcohol dehydrogenase family)